MTFPTQETSVSTLFFPGMLIALRLEWKYYGGLTLCECGDIHRSKREKTGWSWPPLMK
jgi:hypothetical protein